MNASELEHGTPVQRAAYAALRTARVFEILSPYDPVLAGTIPLDIDTEGSDLDVICVAADLHAFGAVVRSHWPQSHGKIISVRGIDSFVARFLVDAFTVEVFAQDAPVEAQYAVLHLRVERRMLDLGGPAAREAIRHLKRSGMKTEPAFAKYFGMMGDPYDTLASLAALTDDALARAIGLRRL